MRQIRRFNSFASYRGLWAGGFTLIETLAALILLGLIGGGVMITIDRSMDATQELALRRQALTVARENLEQVLTRLSLEESVEQGISDRFPAISWETTLETFGEPASGQTWARVVCSAGYEDESEDIQTVELVHWLTAVKEEGAGDGAGTAGAADREFSYEEALDYAGVNEETLVQWVEAGLKQAADGGFIEHNLDIFIRANGQPTEEEIETQVDSLQELRERMEDRREEEASEDPRDDTAIPADTEAGDMSVSSEPEGGRP
jgi:type II secretory pathway pseudopilin PulG